MQGLEESTYNYRITPTLFTEAKCTAVLNRVQKKYAELTKVWTTELNTEWCMRLYFSTKMILNATLLYNSLQFTTLNGLQIANPYFEYYAVLSLLRGLVCTIPDQKWDNGALMKISHTKAINVSFDWISQYSKNKARELKELAITLRAHREIIAYNAPASGCTTFSSNYDLLDMLTIIAEVSQINSEILFESVKKNADAMTLKVIQDVLAQIYHIDAQGFSFYDAEDMYRLNYIRRRIKQPLPLSWLMTDGQTEDFFGAWDGNDESGESFTTGCPVDWGVIFDIP